MKNETNRLFLCKFTMFIHSAKSFFITFSCFDTLFKDLFVTTFILHNFLDYPRLPIRKNN